MQNNFDPKPSVRRKNHLPENPDTLKRGRFPSWLHRPLPKGNALKQTGDILHQNRLHTVCEEAKCPNLLECWSKKTATFLIMGKECTRACGFCEIDFAKTPAPLDPQEPERVAESVVQLGLNHVVITMVARDDLEDGGAAHLLSVVEAVRKLKPSVTVEILTSDFAGNTASWDIALSIQPEIFNYNIETVRALTPRIRHKATYDRTLTFLHYIHTHKKSMRLMIKSGMMVGLGETEEQVMETLQDLKGAGCDIVTMGQYLQASSRKLRVAEFVTPEQFKKYENYGYDLGFKHMYCSPFVRSSYNAHLVFE